MVRKFKKHVIVAFPPTFISRVDKMSGIFRFASERNGWEIDMRQVDLDASVLSGADGVLITGNVSPRTLRVLAGTDIPTAFIAVESARRRNAVFVTTDPDDIGGRIATRFLSRGIYEEAVVVLDPKSSPFYAAYARAIRRTAAPTPCRTVVGRLDPRTLHTPCIVFAANDYLAARTISDCQAAGLDIPRDVAVMGFANDVVFCENNRPTISSAEPDFERQGYLAAQELDRIMSARTACPRRTLAVGLKRIVERDSTSLPCTGEGLVRRALAFIRRNATRPIEVVDVVAHLKVSRRLAELRFREIRNRTILETIRDIRLDATKEALRASNDPIAAVCERCGWASENGPKKLFRAKYGLSMRDWRAGGRHPAFLHPCDAYASTEDTPRGTPANTGLGVGCPAKQSPLRLDINLLSPQVPGRTARKADASVRRRGRTP